MRWHIKTRSRNRDYSFLGGSPERWWARLRPDTSFERPTLLIERTAERSWRLLASGILSTRKDRTQTQLRYTIVGAGEIDEDVGVALKLVAAWIDEAAATLDESEVQGPLSRALDESFDEATIEGWFNQDPSSQEIGAEVEQRLLSAIERLPSTDIDGCLEEEGVQEDGGPPGGAGALGRSGWYGSLHSAESRQAFLHLTDDLVHGRAKGVAYLLNLADRPEELSFEVDIASTVLLFDVPESRLDGQVPLSKLPRKGAKKKETPAPSPTPSATRAAPTKPPASAPPHPVGHPDDPDDSPGDRGDVEAAQVTAAETAEPAETNGAAAGPADVPLEVHESLRALLSALDEDEGDAEESISASLLRRALPGRDVVRKVRDASRDTLEEVLGTSRETLEEVFGARLGALEEVLGAGRQTLEALRKEVTAAAREGATRSAREVLEAVMTSTRAISGRSEPDASTGAPAERRQTPTKEKEDSGPHATEVEGDEDVEEVEGE